MAIKQWLQAGAQAQLASAALDAANVVPHGPECDHCLYRQAEQHHRQADDEIGKYHVVFSPDEGWIAVARPARQRSSSQIVPQA